LAVSIIRLKKFAIPIRYPEAIQRRVNHGLEPLFATFLERIGGLVALMNMDNQWPEQEIIKRRRNENEQEGAIQYSLKRGGFLRYIVKQEHDECFRNKDRHGNYQEDKRG
jgi:hypothetical protein